MTAFIKGSLTPLSLEQKAGFSSNDCCSLGLPRAREKSPAKVIRRSRKVTSLPGWEAGDHSLLHHIQSSDNIWDYWSKISGATESLKVFMLVCDKESAEHVPLFISFEKLFTRSMSGYMDRRSVRTILKIQMGDNLIVEYMRKNILLHSFIHFRFIHPFFHITI